jgi:hypothetical protein
LSASDPDAGQTHTFSLAAGAGDTDNAAFNISGNQLRLTASAVYATQSSYSVRLRATDNGSPAMFYEETFTITVLNFPATLLHSIPPTSVGVQTDGRLGTSVAVDGIHAVAGAAYDDTGGFDSGVVKVFHATTGALLYLIPNLLPRRRIISDMPSPFPAQSWWWVRTATRRERPMPGAFMCTICPARHPRCRC